LIGGFKDNDAAGAAWLFTRSGSSWTQQGEKLTGGEESGPGQFGWSVALSENGSTALIGGVAENGNIGAAWVFGPPSSVLESQGGSKTPTGMQTQGPAQPQAPGSSTGASSTAEQGVEAYKAVGGGVVLVGRELAVRNGRARVVLRCVASVACHGRLALALRARARAARRSPTLTLATAGFAIAHDRTATVKLKLDRAGRVRLRAARGRLRAALAIRVRSPDPHATQTYTVKLVSRKPRHR
jgi:hypothetical protein